MSEKASPAEIRQLRQLMRGDSYTIDRAERLLKGYNPHELPVDILDVWTQGDLYTMDRAERVQAVWRDRRHREY